MVYNKRPMARRGGNRGGYRQAMNGNLQAQMYGVAPQPVIAIYDYTLDKPKFEGSKNTMDVVFDKEIMDRAANLTPSIEIRNRIDEYAKKVIVALKKEREEQTQSEISIGQISQCGSFITDTTTHSSDKSDILIRLNGLPTHENLSDLGMKIVENMKMVDPRETGLPLATDTGFEIRSHNCKVRVLVTINPTDSEKLEPELHLDITKLMINSFAANHVYWFSGLKDTRPPDFMHEYLSLIRVLKDVRSRYSDFQHLSIWSLQYLAFYCLLNGPNRQKANVATAFRRFFELLAAGIFLPKSPTLVDPTDPSHPIAFDLSYQQRDSICQGAQTLVRIFATGNDGYRAILGTQGTAADLTQTASTWKGIEIRPSIDAYKPGCTDPPPPTNGNSLHVE